MPSHIRASHILVKDEAICNDLIHELDADVERFEALAREYSQCPSGQRGGDLGNFGRGQMVRAFEDTAFDLAVGEISGCFPTEFGYHVVRRTH